MEGFFLLLHESAAGGAIGILDSQGHDDNGVHAGLNAFKAESFHNKNIIVQKGVVGWTCISERRNGKVIDSYQLNAPIDQTLRGILVQSDVRFIEWLVCWSIRVFSLEQNTFRQWALGEMLGTNQIYIGEFQD